MHVALAVELIFDIFHYSEKIDSLTDSLVIWLIGFVILSMISFNDFTEGAVSSLQIISKTFYCFLNVIRRYSLNEKRFFIVW